MLPLHQLGYCFFLDYGSKLEATRKKLHFLRILTTLHLQVSCPVDAFVLVFYYRKQKLLHVYLKTKKLCVSFICRYGNFNFCLREATYFWMVGVDTPPKLSRRHINALGIRIAVW